MVAVFDFVKYSDEIGEHFITDAWGNKVNVRDMDIILTTSQFKLWNAYDNFSTYSKSCQENGVGWGISRFSPKQENKHCFLNYQFNQVLNLNKHDIQNLTKKTIDYFYNIIDGIDGDITYALLYLLGKYADSENEESLFGKINDNVTKALLLNNELINDPYISSHLIHSLNKRIKESYIGNLLVDGHYTMLVTDPLAFCEYIFGQEIKGLLNRGEHYNKYWLDKNKNTIAGLRAPLVYRSEINILKLVNNNEINKWYKYLNNCLVINVFGVDNMIFGGSD
jgi:hypothetical protein